MSDLVLGKQGGIGESHLNYMGKVVPCCKPFQEHKRGWGEISLFSRVIRYRFKFTISRVGFRFMFNVVRTQGNPSNDLEGEKVQGQVDAGF